MASKKKQEIELRFYEIPQGEMVLPLLGSTWIREYGNDISVLHFHNLLEIGYCIDGEGIMVFDEVDVPYRPGMLTIIPKNLPHTTKSELHTKSYWEYLFINPDEILKEAYPDNEMFREKISKLVNGNEQYFYQGENDELIKLVRMIMEECRDRKNFSREYLKGLLLAMMIALSRQEKKQDNLPDGVLNGPQQKLPEENASRQGGIYSISGALEYISKRYMEDIRLETLASCCSLSETHFRRLFVEYMNMTPVEYINLVRIQQACELMKKTHCSMEELAEKVGYTTISTFNRNFRKIIGTSPYQYKKNSKSFEGKLLNVKVSAKKGW